MVVVITVIVRASFACRILHMKPKSARSTTHDALGCDAYTFHVSELSGTTTMTTTTTTTATTIVTTLLQHAKIVQRKKSRSQRCKKYFAFEGQ